MAHEFCICRTETDPRMPCTELRSEHREGYEVRGGPDREQRHLYKRFWYDDARRRGGEDEPFGRQPAGDPLWKAAEIVYCTPRARG